MKSFLFSKIHELSRITSSEQPEAEAQMHHINHIKMIKYNKHVTTDQALQAIRFHWKVANFGEWATWKAFGQIEGLFCHLQQAPILL